MQMVNFRIATLTVVLMSLIFGADGFPIFDESQRSTLQNLSKRDSEAIHHIKHTLYNVLRDNVGVNKRSRRRRYYMSDAGYGSRIYAASRLARARSAFHDIFGRYGPGK